jgi:hypothetical protein
MGEVKARFAPTPTSKFSNNKNNPDAASQPRDAMRPSRAFISRPQGGRGECRMPAAPAVSCAIGVIERTRVTTSTPESPGIPARNGFNSLCRALPGDRALCHRRLRINPTCAESELFSQFTEIGASRIKGLRPAPGRFGSVVPTLGIDVHHAT